MRSLILAGLVLTGLASQYGPGMMDRVIINRQTGRAWVSLPARLPIVDGHIAVKDCDQLGRIWMIRRAGVNESWRRMLVVDCAGPQLRPDGMTGGQWMELHNVMLELPYPWAQRWNTVGEMLPIERLITAKDLQ